MRIVTYNVHSCIGLDGRLSPKRIARVLAALDPDVIALQELDVGRLRSGSIDQAQAIADALEMEGHFGAAIEVSGEKYGNAILSRLPMTLKRASLLPGGGSRQEPRGAIWATIDVDGQPLEVVATHLSLSPAERRRQIEFLLSPPWPTGDEASRNVVLCGDFNTAPGSVVYREVERRFRDAQAGAGKRAAATWFSPFPLLRLDHVFVSPALRVVKASVSRIKLARVASDHLPVVVDLEITPIEIDKT